MRQTKTRRQKLLCGILLVLVGASLAHAQTVQEIARSARDSTVLLVMEDANGQPLASAVPKVRVNGRSEDVIFFDGVFFESSLKSIFFAS